MIHVLFRWICFIHIIGVCINQAIPDPVYPTTCGIEYRSLWPTDKRNDQLRFVSNENGDLSGPIYGLSISEEGLLQTLEPGKTYKLTLKSLTNELSLHRFLIWAESLTENCTEGVFRSLSDKSEHVMYNCPRYLMDRTPLFSSNEQIFEVDFTWEAPLCGCTEIGVQVLSKNGFIFTPADDPFNAMTLKLCVRQENDKMQKHIEEVESGEKNSKNDEFHELRNKVLRRNGKLICCQAGAKESIRACKTEVPNVLASKVKEDFKLPLVQCKNAYDICCTDNAKEEEFQKHLRKVEEKWVQLVSGSVQQLEHGEDTSITTIKKEKNGKSLKRKGKLVCCQSGVEEFKVKGKCPDQIDEVTFPLENISVEIPKDRCWKSFKNCCEDNSREEKLKKKMGKYDKAQVLR